MTDHTLPGYVPADAAPPVRLSKLLRQQRWQLGGALLIGLILPFLFRDGGSGIGQMLRDGHNLALVFGGIVLSHVVLRQFCVYPGETPLTAALPAASIGFGIIVAAILLGHLDYSRALLVWGYVATVTWYAALGFLKSRYFRPRLALIPDGRSAGLASLPRVDWVTLSSPISLAAARSLHGVAVDLSGDLPVEWRNFILSCGTAGVPVFDSARAREMMTGQVELSSLANIGFDAHLPHRTYKKIKCLVDIAAAVAVLPLVLLVIAMAGVAIRLESAGPVFFVQKRIGYRGRIFHCYKLRSMHVAAEAAGPSFTAAGDPRITRVGRFIRKFRIDELPQVFNILKCEMSWIGPRPEALALAQMYERNIPYYAFRHSVKPGITGWAAIRQGNVAEVDAATAKLRYDFFYIKNLSPSLDALIAAKTVWTMLTGFGSK